VDLAYFWDDKIQPKSLADALSKALVLFPCLAGRYVQQEVFVEPSSGVQVKEVRHCVLCNNAGAAFRYRCNDGKRPSVIGPLLGIFDQAVGTMGKGSGNGPLLRVRLSEYEDGQILAVSVSQGVADVFSIGLFLEDWSRFYQGEEPAVPADDRRTIFEGAINNGFPLLESDYTHLYRSELTFKNLAHKAVVAAAERPGVCSFLLDWKELASLSASFSKNLQSRRLIFDSEPLEPDEVGFAVAVEGIQSAVCASFWLNMRHDFGFDRLLGHARGVADADLPADYLAAVAELRKRMRTARKRDFWSWKAQQARTNPVDPSAEIIFCSWLQDADLKRCGFSSAQGAGLGASFWQRWTSNPKVRSMAGGGGAVGGNGNGCPSLVVVLPHADGVQVQALLPPAAGIRLCSKRKCLVFYP